MSEFCHQINLDGTELFTRPDTLSYLLALLDAGYDCQKVEDPPRRHGGGQDCPQQGVAVVQKQGENGEKYVQGFGMLTMTIKMLMTLSLTLTLTLTDDGKKTHPSNKWRLTSNWSSVKHYHGTT